MSNRLTLIPWIRKGAIVVKDDYEMDMILDDRVHLLENKESDTNKILEIVGDWYKEYSNYDDPVANMIDFHMENDLGILIEDDASSWWTMTECEEYKKFFLDDIK